MIESEDILYCKKDFICKENNSFRVKKGKYVLIESVSWDNQGEKKGLRGFSVTNHLGQKTWIVVNRTSNTRKLLSNAWDYFRDFNRIRRVAKEYINEEG